VITVKDDGKKKWQSFEAHEEGSGAEAEGHFQWSVTAWGKDAAEAEENHGRLLEKLHESLL